MLLSFIYKRRENETHINIIKIHAANSKTGLEKTQILGSWILRRNISQNHQLDEHFEQSITYFKATTVNYPQKLAPVGKFLHKHVQCL